MPDFQFVCHGSLWLVEPQTPEAQAHLEAHTSPEAQWFGGALAVEPRYVQDLVEALWAEGFSCA